MVKIDEMSCVLTNKKNKMQEILELTKLQKDAIENKNDEKLSELIDKKQLAINQIDALDMKFNSLFNEVKKDLGVSSLEEIKDKQEFKEVKIYVEEIIRLINEIISIEKENSVKIREEYDDIKDKIRQINDVKKATNAYEGMSKTMDGVFIDKKK